MTAPNEQHGTGDGSAPDGTIRTFCFRHPDRETYVSCVRCGRHACPDCLRSAAVGQQCVDCVREGHRGTRAATAVFGGRPSRAAVVTWSLMAINVIAFLAEIARPGLLYDWGMLGLPALAPGNSVQPGVVEGQWYRLITSAFTAPGTSLSGLGLLDIAFNMWALYIVGPSLERLLGPVRFLAVYLLSAVGGGVMFYYLDATGFAAGASGAVFGLFGAWFVVSKRLHLDIRGIVTLIAVNLAFGFIVPNIAWQDHLGGIIAGAALTAAYAYAPTKNRALIQAAATVALVAILALAVIVRNGQLS